MKRIAINKLIPANGNNPPFVLSKTGACVTNERVFS